MTDDQAANILRKIQQNQAVDASEKREATAKALKWYRFRMDLMDLWEMLNTIQDGSD